METIYRRPSPCLGCSRVKDPKNCENKQCKVWQEWFLERWEMIRAYPRQQMEQAQLKPVGVNVGGRYYSAPHQLEAYKKQDPCESCLCPKDLCTSPCSLRRVWAEGKEG